MTVPNNPQNKFTILISIFFISVSLFVYQVVLTRLYSAVFSYHYVFLITSLAILGLGIGSIFAYSRRNKTRLAGIKQKVAKGSLILTATYIATFLLNYLLPYMDTLLVYIVLGTIPFIAGGYVYTILFTEFSGISGKLYFADLIGSGIGSLAVILLLNNAGMFRTVIVLCIMALIPAAVLPQASFKLRIIGYTLPVVLIAGLLLPGQYVSSIEKNFGSLLGNSNKTFGSIKASGSSPEIVYSKWNAFSRTDVIKIPEIENEMILTIDGGANASMYKFDGNIANLQKMRSDTGYLPFTFGSNEKTLLLGSGGGRDVLYALAAGSRDISAVDINTSSIDAVKALGGFNGNIYDRPEVRVYADDGRNFVRKSGSKYDTIFLSLVMTNTSQGAGYALSENYIYTVEAVEDYLGHLTENGKIAFVAHEERDLGKLVATALEALNRRGVPVKDAPGYIALFAQKSPDGHSGGHVHEPVIIIKSKPFTKDEGRELLDTAGKAGNIPIYAPFVYEKGILQHVKDAHITLKDYLNGFSTNVTPATDNSPYFFNFSKGISKTLVLILLAVVIGGLVMFVPFAAKAGNFKSATYFGLLGAGFMLIEVPLVQKFILYLGHPVLAFTYVLAALLIGCGLGGYLSGNRIFERVVKSLYLPPVAVVAINIALLLSLDFIFQSTSAVNLTGRIIIASLLVMLQGFFLGMPFPRGLKLIGANGRSEIVPVMWGINGVTSVIGSVLSVALSMTVGFTGALIAGAFIYLIVSFYKTL